MRALYWEQEPEDFVGIKSLSLLKSDNPLVTSAWISGDDTSDTKPCIHIISGEIKPGLHPDNKDVKRFNLPITKKQIESLDIPEAIEWINNLKPEE